MAWHFLHERESMRLMLNAWQWRQILTLFAHLQLCTLSHAPSIMHSSALAHHFAAPDQSPQSFAVRPTVSLLTPLLSHHHASSSLVPFSPALTHPSHLWLHNLAAALETNSPPDGYAVNTRLTPASFASHLLLSSSSCKCQHPPHPSGVWPLFPTFTRQQRIHHPVWLDLLQASVGAACLCHQNTIER